MDLPSKRNSDSDSDSDFPSKIRKLTEEIKEMKANFEEYRALMDAKVNLLTNNQREIWNEIMEILGRRPQSNSPSSSSEEPPQVKIEDEDDEEKKQPPSPKSPPSPNSPSIPPTLLEETPPPAPVVNEEDVLSYTESSEVIEPPPYISELMGPHLSPHIPFATAVSNAGIRYTGVPDQFVYLDDRGAEVVAAYVNFFVQTREFYTHLNHIIRIPSNVRYFENRFEGCLFQPSSDHTVCIESLRELGPINLMR